MTSSSFRNARGEAEYMAAYNNALACWPQPFDTLETAGRFGCTHIHAAGPKDAPPLFLLHGYGFTSTMWAPNVTALSKDHRVYAPDTLGDMGRSVAAQMPASGKEYAEWLGSIFDELRIERANVAGLSYGGWIAANAAVHMPERVGRLILMDPAATLLPMVPEFTIRSVLSMFLPGHAAIYSFMRWMTSRRSPLGKSDLSRQPVIRQFAVGFKTWKMEGGIFPSILSDDELSGIKARSLLMMGENEVIYSPTRAIERARRLIRGLRVEVIPNAGHAINMEQPEIVNDIVVKFLA